MDDSNFNKENLGQSSNTSSTKDVRLRDVVGNPADFEKWVTHWCGRQPEETTISGLLSLAQLGVSLMCFGRLCPLFPVRWLLSNLSVFPWFY